MKLFTINIGLNNNPLTQYREDGYPSIVQESIESLLRLAFNYSSPFYRIETGKWDDADEPTFVGYIDADESTIDAKVQLLCDIMTQQCIPYYSKYQSNLVYQTGWNKTKFDFNPTYFIK